VHLRYLPSAPAARERTMEAFQAPLVPHLLLPHRDVRAVIAHVGIQWRERGPEHHEGRLLGLEVGLVGSARPLGRHGNDMGERERERQKEREREGWRKEGREDGIAFSTALQGKEASASWREYSTE
jgi:hypothetical protein